MRIESLVASRLAGFRLWLLFTLAGAFLASLAGFCSEAADSGSVKVRVRQEAGQQAYRAGGKLLVDYGSYQLFSMPERAAASLSRESAEIEVDSSVIHLNSGPLDTRERPRRAVAAPQKLAQATSGRRLHLVQFAGPIKPEWLEELKQLGLRIVTYLPENAFLVYGNPQALKTLEDHAATSPHVEWAGPYESTLKTPSEAARGPFLQAHGPTPSVYAVQMLLDPEANSDTLALLETLKLAPFERSENVLNYVNVVVALPAAAVEEVSARPDVISIMPYEPRRKFCERQSQIAAGNLSGNVPSGPGYLAWLASKGFTQGQFDASGFVVDISDSGIDTGTLLPNHFALYTGGVLGSKSRVAYARLEGVANLGSTLAGCDGHGTLNAHIVAGFDNRTGFPFTDSSGYNYGLGICPFVKVGSSVVFDPEYFTNPVFDRLLARAYRDGARISNQSWGGGSSGAYDIDAQSFDALVRDAQPGTSPYPTPGNQEMVVIVAAGNDGPSLRTMGSPATAKNVISVGAGENVQAFGGADSSGIVDSQANSANDLVSFSSRGPCKDGRRKPDLVAAGTHVSGGVYQGSSSDALGSAAACFTGGGISGGFNSSFFPAGQQFFSASSGTSHAAPAVAGGAALVRQYFINRQLKPPSPAMTKAYLINSTRYLTGGSANDTLWSDGQGMGHMNLGMAFDGLSRVLRDQEPGDLLTASGQSRSFTGVISDPAKPFRVTLAWTDAPGSTAGSAYNNNLDLVVKVNNTVYKGNVFSRASSVSGGAADTRNNVESVFLPAGLTGAFAVEVLGANINSDGVPNNATQLDQDFALVVYNAVLEPRPVLAAAGSVLIAEGFPPNQAIDPGEIVSVALKLQNTGTAATTNLTATLKAAGGVVNPGPAQRYGVLVPGGAALERTFTFTANGDCGGPLVAALQLQDGDRDLGTASYDLVFGNFVTVTSFRENFDALVPPALPTGWTATSTTTAPWSSSLTSSDTPRGALAVSTTLTSGVSDLVSPSLVITSKLATLAFRNSFDLEADDVDATLGYDGAVLEMKIGAGSFTDIVEAGGSFVSGGYTHAIDDATDNTLSGRRAWSGKSGGFITTLVNLPGSAAGKAVQFRWRLGTDTGNFYGGTEWRIDTVSVSDGSYVCYLAPGLPALKNLQVGSDQVSFTFQTAAGQAYTVEIAEEPAGPWATLQTITGDGSTISVTDTPTHHQRFYRIRLQ